MKLKDIEKKLHQDIPLSAVMGLKILEHSAERDALRLEFPLRPNVNHLGTAFGGSLYSSCALACYSLLLLKLAESGITDAHIVIGKGEIRYLKPVTTQRWQVESRSVQAWAPKLKQWTKFKKFKIRFEAQVLTGANGKKDCAHFSGDYVILG